MPELLGGRKIRFKLLTLLEQGALTRPEYEMLLTGIGGPLPPPKPLTDEGRQALQELQMRAAQTKELEKLLRQIAANDITSEEFCKQSTLAQNLESFRPKS